MDQKTVNIKQELKCLIEIISDKHTFDKRVEVFSIDAIETEKGLLLKGETTNESAYNELIEEAKKIYLPIKHNIRILPDKVIGENKWGVIYNSVANLHKEPNHASEMVSQLLLGMPVKVLDKSNDWLLIQAPDGYIGWISGSVQRLKHKKLKDYLSKPKITITSQYAKSYTKADVQSQSVSDIVVGNMLTLDCEENDFYKVVYPDGREAFVEKQHGDKLADWLNQLDFTNDSIVNRAKQLMGVPYVWGGTSSKGLDCSGFIKIVYWLHGIIIPRDASQQVRCGVEVDNNGNFDNLQKGDLVFFGEKTTIENPKERVVHVGIYIGNMEFIHADDYIHISSFNREDKLFDEHNTKRYLRSIRYTAHKGTTGITPFIEHPFYTKD